MLREFQWGWKSFFSATDILRVRNGEVSPREVFFTPCSCLCDILSSQGFWGACRICCQTWRFLTGVESAQQLRKRKKTPHKKTLHHNNLFIVVLLIRINLRQLIVQLNLFLFPLHPCAVILGFPHGDFFYIDEKQRISVWGNNPQQTWGEVTCATGAVFPGSALQSYVCIWLFFDGSRGQKRKNKKVTVWIWWFFTTYFGRLNEK